MKFILIIPVLAASLCAQPAAPARPSPVGVLEESGFQPIFDGASLKSWSCNPDFWRVENGEIIGETTATHQPPQNIFCIWKGGAPGDFELKLQYKLTGALTGNSGIQYRSVEMPEVAPWVLKGYQFDIDAQQTYTGQMYEERARAFLALRGQIVNIPDGKKVATKAGRQSCIRTTCSPVWMFGMPPSPQARPTRFSIASGTAGRASIAGIWDAPCRCATRTARS